MSRYSSSAGVPRTTRNRPKNRNIFATAPQLENSAATSSSHPADDEEERHEHAEGHAGELGVEPGDLAFLKQLARDQAGREPAEQQVETQLEREQRKREDQHHDPAHREL